MPILVLPGVVGGQIEATGATRNTRAAADTHEPFVFGQRLTCLARQGVKAGEAVVQLGNDAVQHRLGNRRVATVGVENVFLLFQIFQHLGLQVGPGGHIHDLENRGECVVVLQGVNAGHQLPQALEQLFESQVGPDAFVEGVFVQDHAAGFQWLANHSPKCRATDATSSRTVSRDLPSL